MPARQAAAAAAIAPSNGVARNFSQAPGLRDGNQAIGSCLQPSSAFTIVRSKQGSVCLHVSQQSCLRVSGPAGKMTLPDDGVL
jgi:hypothetical protein